VSEGTSAAAFEGLGLREIECVGKGHETPSRQSESATLQMVRMLRRRFAPDMFVRISEESKTCKHILELPAASSGVQLILISWLD